MSVIKFSCGFGFAYFGDGHKLKYANIKKPDIYSTSCKIQNIKKFNSKSNPNSV